MNRFKVYCWLTVLSCLGAILLNQNAMAKTNAEIQEMIQEVLMDRHPADGPDWWRSLGSNAPVVIISMYESSSHTYQRIRLLQGLGWFNTSEVGDFLKRQADHATDDVIRNTAIRSVGYSQGVQEIEFIAKFLENSDPQTRYTAAETLNRMNDPKAKQIVELYLSREKLGWISQKLNGVLPRPSGRLTPVATSEDRFSREFAGEWRGYWLSPRGPSEKGMSSKPANLQIKFGEPQEIKGTLQVKFKNQEKKWRLDRITGKGGHLNGVLVEEALGSIPQPSPSPGARVALREDLLFDLDLSEQSANFFLELHSRKLGVFAIFRRNPLEVNSK